ncbi:LamG domain-containing protein [Actinomadura opuntiae]|uniref:LamG domain-containing protein n=1 Tax=Actinomadura sp. OS1-43 TaxID=604315 RepID=UPI00255A8D8C|nr:LamG domain-containing protein [Actinomadura sp. OS1-43]MDL4813144.1 LamG domain-containing protein [Actinomadura sp. OS1-43]
MEFTAYETGAYDCNNDTSIQLWRTLQLKSYATWNNTVGSWNDGGAWGEHLTSREVSYCSSAPVEFGGSLLRDHVQSAVDKGYGDITFGLKAYSESSMDWWKRFSDDAYLKIQYNNPPLQPDTDTMFADPGTKCVNAPDAKTVNDLPTVYAYLKDPDTEDKNKVQGQFTLHWANKADGSDWGPKWTSALTPAKTSNTRFSVKLPSTIPQKTKIGWGVRAWDGEQWGPWSYDGAQTGCYFYYDTSVPAKPTITSTDYPNDDAWHGAVGEPGQFHVSDSAGVADRYEVSLNGGPTQTIATSGGAQRNAVLAPTRSGPNILTVQAFAPSGQNGATVSYEFRANTGADPAARFGMDEDAGSSAVTATSPGTAAWLRGNAVLGGEGKNGTALSLDGVYGFAEAGLPQVDSTKSFTVSAWVKPTQTKAGDVLAQMAASQSGFILGMQADGKPVFKSASTDTNDGGGTWHVAAAGSPLALGQWAHLIGVYDQSAAQMQLYVNGQLAGTVSNAAPLESKGAFQIGRSFYNQGFLDYWPGSIDDVTTFSQALTGTQAQQLAAGTEPDGATAHWKMDEPQGAPRAYSPTEPIKATPGSGATLGSAGQSGKALRLDGTANGYAATDHPLINTQRSFAVSAWVKFDGSAAGNDFTALSAAGDNKSAFYLKYVRSTGKWAFARPAQDSDDPGWYAATSKAPAQTDTWTHLVGVYDQNTRKLRIYVNGVAGNDSAVLPSAWKAEGGLQIGRGKWAGNQVDSWKGLIDDVRVYDRVLGADEAEELVTQHPTLKARWILNQDGSGDPDGGLALGLHNTATIDPNAGFRWGSSAAGLQLDAAGKAFAETSAPVVDTSQSFTVAGWVRNMGRPQQPATVFSQAGANTDAFDLRYVPSEDADAQGSWQIVMHNADKADAAPLTATHPKFIEYDWVHLAVVYDALHDRVSLYVNGQLNETSDNVSQEDQVLGFEAKNGGLQVGRNKLGATDGTEFWPDAIDDVWAYQGALTQEQIGQLAGDAELTTENGP